MVRCLYSPGEFFGWSVMGPAGISRVHHALRNHDLPARTERDEMEPHAVPSHPVPMPLIVVFSNSL
jgi:hypothetical protein